MCREVSETSRVLWRQASAGPQTEARPRGLSLWGQLFSLPSPCRNQQQKAGSVPAEAHSECWAGKLCSSPQSQWRAQKSCVTHPQNWWQTSSPCQLIQFRQPRFAGVLYLCCLSFGTNLSGRVLGGGWGTGARWPEGDRTFNTAPAEKACTYISPNFHML